MDVLSLNTFPESRVYPEGFFFLEAMISNNFQRNSSAPIIATELLPSFYRYLLPKMLFLKTLLKTFPK